MSVSATASTTSWSRLKATQAILRANPRYQPVLLDRLGRTERSRLGLESGSSPYGILLPREVKDLEPVSISADTALLFFTLTEPGRLPRYAVDRLGEDAPSVVARLVADGVLEILHDGAFLTGPAGAEILAASVPEGDCRDRSVAALRYAQHLTHLGEQELARRLYFHGRQPISPALSRRFPDSAAIEAYLGLGPDGPVRGRLGEKWAELAVAASGREHWRQWLPRGPRAPARYKLYVSPAVSDFPTAIGEVAAVLPSAPGLVGFKIGSGLEGLCRPDKLILYFLHLDDLNAFARRLEARLAGCAAHGVAFTAPVTRDGLLAWGADPPGFERPISWRLWVAQRLAAYLIETLSVELKHLQPWEFARERLRLNGIDVRTWVPAANIWSEALETA